MLEAARTSHAASIISFKGREDGENKSYLTQGYFYTPNKFCHIFGI